MQFMRVMLHIDLLECALRDKNNLVDLNIYDVKISKMSQSLCMLH